MSRLSDLLERAFENKGHKNRYSTGPWSIAFNERTWDTRFELYYNNICALEGNTLDKELKVTNTEAYPLEKLVPEVEKALPEYHFDIHLSLLIPVDFDDYWEQEVEGAEYLRTADTVRYEDIEDGIGYDVVLFSIPRLLDLKNVTIEYKDRSVYKIDGYEMRLDKDGAIEVSPTYLAPVKALANEGREVNASDCVIDRAKLAEYLEDELIIEFSSPGECLAYFNTYDGQHFQTIEEMKAYQGPYGFGLDGKWYHISFDEGLDVRVSASKPSLESAISAAKDQKAANYNEKSVDKEFDNANPGRDSAQDYR